ncbi:MAG TPA: efflux RND transporter periplasmic adaptor subunit [Rhizobiaceae bacterium]|nr:efflux RND transporter periplasmic adaptor subunit [Rhizobiaceae bacterium]
MRRTIVIVLFLAVGAALAVSHGWSGAVLRQLVSRPGVAARAAPAGANTAPAVSVATAVASTADFPVRRYAIGSVLSPAVVEIGARIASVIVAIPIRDGQMVKAGDILFQLDDRALKAQLDRDQATLAKDQALLASAKADLERARDLAAKQAGTAQAYDQALAAERGLESTIKADQATVEADQVQLGYATITAPISGRLGAVAVTVGDLVAPVTSGALRSLVTVTQMDPLDVSFNLPQTDLPLLQKAIGGPAAAKVDLYLAGQEAPVATGTLEFVDSTVDTASGTVAVKARFQNKDLALWPGQYVDVVLEAGVMTGMTSIPTVAVQSGQKGTFVYVVRGDDTVEVRPVTVVLAEGGNSAVSAGLSDGERVVVDGQTHLKQGSKVRYDRGTRSGPTAPQASDNPGNRP